MAGLGRSPSCDSVRLPLHEFPKHFFRIDGDEDSLATRENFPFFIHDFSHVDVLAAMDCDFPAFNAQGLMERHGPHVLHGHLFGQRNHVAKFVHLPHSVVENCCDDSAMAVSRRTRVALAEPEAAHKGLTIFIQCELQVHAVGIVLPTGEAIVFLHFDVGRLVTMYLARHGWILPR